MSTPQELFTQYIQAVQGKGFPEEEEEDSSILSQYLQKIKTPVEDTSRIGPDALEDYAKFQETQTSISPPTGRIRGPYGIPFGTYKIPGYSSAGVGTAKTYTLDDLETNKEFQQRTERFMESIGEDEEIFEYLRDPEFSITSAITRASAIGNWSKEAKEDYVWLRNKFQNAEIGGLSQKMALVGDFAWDTLTDPFNILSLLAAPFTFGQSATARVAIGKLASEGAKKLTLAKLKGIGKGAALGAKRPAIAGSLEGAAWAGVHNYYTQSANKELDLVRDVDLKQTAGITAFGAVAGGTFGGILGGGAGAFTVASPKFSRWRSVFSDDVSIDQSVDPKNPKQTRQQVINANTAIDAEENPKRKLPNFKVPDQVKWFIGETTGKSTTALQNVALQSKQLAKFLGNIRYDWYRTLVKGVKEPEGKTFGELWGRLAGTWNETLEDGLGVLKRKGHLFKSYIDEEENGIVHDLIINPQNRIKYKGTPDGDRFIYAAEKIEEMLKDIFERSNQAGLIDFRQFVKNYFPRKLQFDKILENRGIFEALLIQHKYADPLNIISKRKVSNAFDPETGKVLLDDKGKPIKISTDFRAIDFDSFKDAKGRGRDFVDEVSNGRTTKFEELTTLEKSKARQAKAKAIVDNILDKKHNVFEWDSEFGLAGEKAKGAGGVGWLQPRIFDRISENSMKRFIDTDIERVLRDYINTASRANARARTFGKSTADFEKNYITKIDEELKSSGLTLEERQKVINRVRKMYNRISGIDYPHFKNPAARAVADVLKLSQQMAHLPLATLSSITEPMILLARAEAVDAPLSAKDLSRALVLGVKKDLNRFSNAVARQRGKAHYGYRPSKKAQKLTGVAGLSDEAWQEAYQVGLAFEQAIMDRLQGLYGETSDNPIVRGLTAAFFKSNLLTTWTGTVQLASFTTGKRLIKKNIRELHEDAEGITKLSSERKEILTEQLWELGINEKDGMIWYRNSLNKDGTFSEKLSKGKVKGPDEDLVKGATKAEKAQAAFYENHFQMGANRFAREVILNPSTAEGNKPLWFSHPAGQLLMQFAGYPTVFNNTVLKRFANDSIRHPLYFGPKVIATTTAMTAVAVLGNALRTNGESLDKEPGAVVAEGIRRWGGFGPAESVRNFMLNKDYGSGQIGSLVKAPFGPLAQDAADALLYRKGIPEVLASNLPFYSAYPFEWKQALKRTARGTKAQKKKVQRPTYFGNKYTKAAYTPFYEGGKVSEDYPVPNASPDPSTTKVRGLNATYAELADFLGQDVEDRGGFAEGGQASRQEEPNLEALQYLSDDLRKAAPILEDERPITRHTEKELKAFSKDTPVVHRAMDDISESSNLEEFRFSDDIGVHVGTKEFAQTQRTSNIIKGKIRLTKTLDVSDLNIPSYKGISFVEELKSNPKLQNKILKDSALPKKEAKQFINKLIDEYKGVKKIILEEDKIDRKVLLYISNIKLSNDTKDTLKELGYDSIITPESTILFDVGQFRGISGVAKTEKTPATEQMERLGFASGDEVLESGQMSEEHWERLIEEESRSGELQSSAPLLELIFGGTARGLTYLGRKAWKKFSDDYANKEVDEILYHGGLSGTKALKPGALLEKADPRYTKLSKVSIDALSKTPQKSPQMAIFTSSKFDDAAEYAKWMSKETGGKGSVYTLKHTAPRKATLKLGRVPKKLNKALDDEIEKALIKGYRYEKMAKDRGVDIMKLSDIEKINYFAMRDKVFSLRSLKKTINKKTRTLAKDEGIRIEGIPTVLDTNQYSFLTRYGVGKVKGLRRFKEKDVRSLVLDEDALLILDETRVGFEEGGFASFLQPIKPEFLADEFLAENQFQEELILEEDEVEEEIVEPDVDLDTIEMLQEDLLEKDEDREQEEDIRLEDIQQREEDKYAAKIIKDEEWSLETNQDTPNPRNKLPLALRQLLYDSKYDFLRTFLPDHIADSITGKVLDPDEPITAEHLTTEEFTVLQKSVQIALDQNSTTITYDIWREAGAGGTSTIHDNPFTVFTNPVKSLQFTFGEADLTVDDNGDIRLIDRFNWNDADPTKRYRDPADWSEEGFLLMKDVKSFNDWAANQFRKVRNYKTSFGRPEGHGSFVNVYVGNIKDFETQPLLIAGSD